jgi:hypothetical protein
LEDDDDPEELPRSRDSYMMDVWTWEFAYDYWTVENLEEALFWYAASGQAISHESTTERWWTQISRGRLREVAPAARARWNDIREIAPKLRALDVKTAFGWFLDGRARRAWDLLREIKYVGPKIASWVLRDLSFLRDYATDLGGLRVDIGYPECHRVTRWFSTLPVQEQALFLPLDRWAIRAAHEHGILPASMTIEHVQGNLDHYLEAVIATATWARSQNLDPRDLNVYFYLTGEGSLRSDGICPLTEKLDVWWCYNDADRVNLEQDWLEGSITKLTATEATVHLKGQLRDARTGLPIAEQDRQVPLDRLRPDE